MQDEFRSLKSLFDLNGKVAVVTGGSRGLGLQIAEALGEYGATLVLSARKEDELAEAVKHLEGRGAKAVFHAADLGKPEGVNAFVDWLGERFPAVDILVNNAGTSWGAPTVDHPLDAWNKVVSLNLTAPFLLTQAIAKRWMVPRRSGRILNIASIEGLLGYPPALGAMVAYSTTKGGLVNFTRALAAEWGPFNITVNALAPGFFPSKLTKAVLSQHEQELIAGTPMGKLGGANDLKGATLLFASDACGHITGQILAIDGGASII